MPEYVPCQVCGYNDWQPFAERCFSKSDMDAIDDFNKNIYRFMFDVWFPGQSEIRFQNCHCNKCGLICFFPRPTVTDLDKLRQRNTDSTVGYHPETDLGIAKRRSQYLYDYLARHHNMKKVRRVLDYGGSDGNLMEAFLANGKECFLVDYCPISIPGVTKIGNTVHDLNEDDEFDLIICNHVIEHVAAPRETVETLLGHLNKTGILFIEVPMELWKRPPLLTQKNPITHVNFFSPNSLKNLFIAAGASVLKCELTEYLHTSSRWNPGIRCIGQPKTSVHPSDKLLKPDSLDFLRPKFKTYLRYYLGNSRKLKSELAKRFRPPF